MLSEIAISVIGELFLENLYWLINFGEKKKNLKKMQ
jgi:hypothetical protein